MEKISEEETNENYVRRVLSCKNFYEVLEVSENASDSAIVTAHRKLAKNLHPDKNRAPGATDAMQMVNKAKEVLTDPNKRHEHDMKMNEGSDNWILDDVIFPAVLVGAIAVGALALLNWFFNSPPSPIYSLVEDRKYPIRRETIGDNIPYYVSADFSQKIQSKYGGSLIKFEKDVREKYRNENQ